MKLKEIKHNHSLTDLLKILIFAILMLAPITAVATRCMYVVCNKNAYQSYSGTNNVKQYVDLTNVPMYDVYYTFNQEISYVNAERKILTLQNIEYVNGSLPSNYITTLLETDKIEVWQDANNLSNYATWVNAGTNISANTYQFTIKCDVVGINGYITSSNLQNKLAYESVNNNPLDNVFEYSVNELENSQLFNWTENTAIYTGVKAMTTQLEITGNVIPILITYWFLLTVIYVIIDIILKLFTVLTHMIGSKQA